MSPNYQPFREEFIETTGQDIAKRAGISERSLLRYLNRGEESEVKRLENVIGLKIKITRTDSGKRKFWIENNWRL